MRLRPPPGESAKVLALVNGAKKTPLKLMFSLRRIASAVRQARTSGTAGLETWAPPDAVATAGVSKGS